MTSGLLTYLAAATAVQAAFALLYWLGLARLTAFGWNRAYLLLALVLPLALPVLALPAAWAQLLRPAAPGLVGLPAWALAAGPAPAGPAGEVPAVGISWAAILVAGYWLGVAWQVGRTGRSLGWLYRLVRRHPRTRLGRGWLVQLPAPGRPAFSFGRYVFLSPAHAQLSPTEDAQLLAHEQLHGAQYHSLDLLLAEVVGWFFWFNGLLPYLRRQLQTVHEYLADAAVARPAGHRAAYGQLLLKLAAGPLPAAFVHPFFSRQVALRLQMLTSPPSSPMKKLRFLLVVPVVALAWVGAAALRPTPTQAATTAIAPGKAQGRIGTITWQGNTFLTTAQLNEALHLKPGDPYDPETVSAQLHYRPDGQDVESRYMDHGYLFFHTETVTKTRPDGSTDLTFVIAEGPTTRINTLTVKGNRKVATADVLKLVTLHQGELFSRAKLVQSQRALAESGYFAPDKIGVNPLPLPAQGLVNVEFVVVEK